LNFLNKMDKETKEKILRDYHEAQKNIGEILEGKRVNSFVKSTKEYLKPSVVIQSCEMSDETGEFNYYVIIRNTLENLLVGRKAESSCHFNDAPEYIKELLSNQ
jgi:hypothetical protein